MGSIMERGRAHEFRAVMDYAYECGKQLDDRIVNGQIEFDYRLKPGVVTHSNALELMRAIGLEV